MQDNNENNNLGVPTNNKLDSLADATQSVAPNDSKFQAPETMPTAKKSHKLIFILLAAVAVFIVILLGYVIYNSSIKNQPNKEALKASDNFIKAIESNSIQSAYSNTTDNYKSTNSESAFTDFASKFASKINPDYTVVISNTINSSGPNQNATIIYNGQDKGTAKNEYIKVVLEKVGSNWKVQSISYQQTPYGGNQ